MPDAAKALSVCQRCEGDAIDDLIVRIRISMLQPYSELKGDPANRRCRLIEPEHEQRVSYLLEPLRFGDFGDIAYLAVDFGRLVCSSHNMRRSFLRAGSGMR